LHLKDTNQKTNDASERGPYCHGSIRRWAHGCYTLVHDTDPEGAEFALDALLYVGGSGKEHKIGNMQRFYSRGQQPCKFIGTKEFT